VPTKDTMLNINEIFGPTFQGEGIFTGQVCVFCRTYTCNQHCWWCDTWYTWADTEHKATWNRLGLMASRDDESHLMTVMQVREEVQRTYARPCIVVISGGEPLLQTTTDPHNIDKLGELAQTLCRAGYSIHIETAGTRLPGRLLNSYVEHYVVSPKLASSRNPKSLRYRPQVLDWFAERSNVTFKFVITAASIMADLEEVDKMVADLEIPPGQVMLMPEGVRPSDVLEGTRMLAPAALSRGFGLSTRLHTLIWGEARGH
jgi:7-carboxy-7-deazaguanine synthase